MAILVVVCGKICSKICGKMCGKIENCRIGTKIGVVVDMDPVIMIVVTKRQKKCGKICGKMCGKIEKLLDCNKNWCGSRYGPRDYDSGDKKTQQIVVKFVVNV